MNEAEVERIKAMKAKERALHPFCSACVKYEVCRAVFEHFQHGSPGCWYRPSEFIDKDSWIVRPHGPEEVPKEEDKGGALRTVFIETHTTPYLGYYSSTVKRWSTQDRSYEIPIDDILGWYDLPGRDGDE